MARNALIFTAALPVGLAVGSAVWLFIARPPAASALAALNSQLAGVAGRRRAAAHLDGVLRLPSGPPLFAVTTGPGAVLDVAVRVDGLVRTPGRVAALLSINGAAPEWLEVGQTRDGVTLQEVAAAKVVIDTALGIKEVQLGEATAPASPAASSASSPMLTTDAVPKGFRAPPPPASAPGVPR